MTKMYKMIVLAFTMTALILFQCDAAALYGDSLTATCFNGGLADCWCPPGYDGNLCKYRPATSGGISVIFCFNGGTAYCSCAPDYYGNMCQYKLITCPTLECDPNLPCTSGYRYSPLPGEYQSCPTCECIDPCEYSPCSQGEVCSATYWSCIALVGVVCPYPTVKCTAAEDALTSSTEISITEATKATTTPCPSVECDPNRPCTSGYRSIQIPYQYPSCPTCECIDPCEYSPCSQGEVCSFESVHCIALEGVICPYPTAICTPAEAGTAEKTAPL